MPIENCLNVSTHIAHMTSVLDGEVTQLKRVEDMIRMTDQEQGGSTGETLH